MTPDLHPEELLDKAAVGTLSDSERVWLDQHLAQCSVCRFEQAARADFAEVPNAAVDVEGLVTRALAGLPSRTAKASAARSGRRSVAMLAAAALTLTTMASFAAVAQWTGVLPKLLQAISSPVASPAAPPAPVRRAGHAKADDPEPPRAAEEPVVNREVVPLPPPAPTALRRVALPREVAAVTAPIVAAALPMPPDAGSLFAEANDARVRGQREGAVRLYRDLLQRYPGAPEARLSQATLGRLLLDTGDPAGALDELDTYLRSGELTLREEVLSARAIALSRLGRTVEEAAAWNALLEGYPDSIHAPRARARLQELAVH